MAAVTASGRIEPKSQVDISSEVTARITRITVKEGDLVTKGQLLMELDQVQFLGAVERSTASLASIEAQLMQSRANRDQAKRTYDRNRELKRTNPTLLADEVVEQSQLAYDLAAATVRSSEAQVMQTRATLKEARDNLARTRLFSPIAGRVVRLAVEEGEVAQTGAFSRDVGLLMRIADLSVIQALVKVDETDVVRLSLDDSVGGVDRRLPRHAVRGTHHEDLEQRRCLGRWHGGQRSRRRFRGRGDADESTVRRAARPEHDGPHHHRCQEAGACHPDHCADGA